MSFMLKHILPDQKRSRTEFVSVILILILWLIFETIFKIKLFPREFDRRFYSTSSCRRKTCTVEIPVAVLTLTFCHLTNNKRKLFFVFYESGLVFTTGSVLNTKKPLDLKRFSVPSGCLFVGFAEDVLLSTALDTSRVSPCS